MAKMAGSSAGAHKFFGWIRPREPVPLDAADLGTAFGLEVSLGEPDERLRIQPAEPGDEPAELREPPRF